MRAVERAVRARRRRQAAVGRDELLDELQAPEPGGGAQVARVHAALGQQSVTSRWPQKSPTTSGVPPSPRAETSTGTPSSSSIRASSGRFE